MILIDVNHDIWVGENPFIFDLFVCDCFAACLEYSHAMYPRKIYQNLQTARARE